MTTLYNEDTGAKTVDGPTRKLFKVEGDIRPDEFYEMRIKANRPLTDEEVKHLLALADYSWTVTTKAPALEFLGRTGKKSFAVATELDKSFSHDPLGRAQEFINGLNAFIATGSPERKTKQNTRAVEPMPDTTVSVWVSNVFKEEK